MKKFFGAVIAFLVAAQGCAGAVVSAPPDEPEPAASATATSSPRASPSSAPSAEPCCGLFTCGKLVVPHCDECVGEKSCCWDATGVPCAKEGS